MTGYDTIAAQEFGGPDVLKMVHVGALPEPGAGEVRLRVEAAGVGYTDTIVRRGRYIAYTGGLPVTPGYDVVGLIDAIGADVTGFAVGDRVADMPVSGAYSQFMLRPAATLVPVPAGVAPAAAVEMPLMWMTAWQMLTRCAALGTGVTILVVGASGAVGRALVLLGHHLGLKIIGTCSASHIAELEKLGVTAIDYRRTDLASAIKTANGGAGVAAVFDAVGGTSWQVSWDVLINGGVLVGYGLQDFIESGAPGAEAMRMLTQFNQTWPEQGKADGTGRTTTWYDISLRRAPLPEDYHADAVRLLDLMAKGVVLPPRAETLPLAQAADAHRRIAAGGLDHRLVLCPWQDKPERAP